MKSYDIVEWGKPLQEVLRDTPKPVGTEVLVKVQAGGICHSDLHIRDCFLDLGNGKHISFENVGVKLPFTMGHEIVGVVAEAGGDASVKAGTPCVVYPWHGCGTCLNCTNGREVDCESGRALGTRKPGDTLTTSWYRTSSIFWITEISIRCSQLPVPAPD